MSYRGAHSEGLLQPTAVSWAEAVRQLWLHFCSLTLVLGLFHPLQVQEELEHRTRYIITINQTSQEGHINLR